MDQQFYVNIGPSFINETSGNGSTWTLTNFRSLSPGWMGNNMYFLVGDTFYFDAYGASTGLELWAHNLSNGTTWQVADISSAYSSSPGRSMAVLVGDTIYFGPVMESRAKNCGLTMPQTTPHG